MFWGGVALCGIGLVGFGCALVRLSRLPGGDR